MVYVTLSMTQAIMENDKEEKVWDRLSIRVEPEFNQCLEQLAASKGIDKSKLTRFALEEYLEKHESEFAPRLIRWFKELLSRRGRHIQ